MVDRSELRLGQHVVVRLCGGETVGAVVDGLCNDWVGVRPDRGGYVIADWEDIEVVRTVLAVKKELPLMDGDADLYFDEWNQQKQNPTKRQCFDEGIRYAQRLKKEQKPAWSEEDEKMLNLTKTQLRILQSHLSHTHSESMSDMEYSSRLLQIEKCVSWLDIRLKSLRPCPSWKPSEEQMRAFERASTNKYLSAKQFDILVSLYEQLKKL